MSGRRGLLVTVLACVVASALVLFAASRGWGTVTVERPAPLPPTVSRRTGSTFAPWLPALGVVGLAAAGALLATRGVARMIVGGLLAATGLGIAVVSLTPLAEGAGPAWSVVCAFAGLVVAAAGAGAVRSGGSWPAMGARYERPVAVTRGEPATQAELWDALDRGEDPTSRGD